MFHKNQRSENNVINRLAAGIKWSALAQFGRQGMQFVATAILAHLLSPETYGLLGMVLVITGFISIFKDLGTSSAIVQCKELTEDLISTIFWFNLILGIGISLLLFWGAPLGAVLYNEPRLTVLLQVLSISFLISSLSVVHQSLLSRRMEFNRLAKVELLASGMGAVTGIVLAATGWGVWSLVAQSLMVVISTTVLLWIVIGWRPQWLFDWRAIRSVANYSLNLSGYTTFNYFVRNADNFLIGRYLGATPLGYYALAYQLMLSPIQNVTSVVSRVLFPALAQIRDDSLRFRLTYLKICEWIALATFPMMLGLIAIADLFVTAVFGAQWLPTATLLVVLAPVGMLQSIGATVGPIYMAKGRTDWMFRWGIATGLLAVTAFIIGLRWNILGVAVAYAVLSLILAYPNFAIPFKLIDLKVTNVWKAVWPVLWPSVVMALGVWTIRVGLGSIGLHTPWILLAICILSGGFIYLAILIYSKPDGLMALLSDMGMSRFSLVRWLFRLDYIEV